MKKAAEISPKIFILQMQEKSLVKVKSYFAKIELINLNYFSKKAPS